MPGAVILRVYLPGASGASRKVPSVLLVVSRTSRDLMTSVAVTLAVGIAALWASTSVPWMAPFWANTSSATLNASRIENNADFILTR